MNEDVHFSYRVHTTSLQDFSPLDSTGIQVCHEDQEKSSIRQIYKRVDHALKKDEVHDIEQLKSLYVVLVDIKEGLHHWMDKGGWFKKHVKSLFFSNLENKIDKSLKEITSLNHKLYPIDTPELNYKQIHAKK